LGGYISANYALKYPQHLERLILASPVGVPKPPEKMFQNSHWMYKAGSRVQRFTGWSPFTIVRLAGHYGPTLARKYTSRRFPPEAFLDQEALHDYFYKPLSDGMLEKMEVNTLFIYGMYDWMDFRAALGCTNRMKPRTNVVRIPRAGHQLFIENPAQFHEAVRLKFQTDVLITMPDNEGDPYVHRTFFKPRGDLLKKVEEHSANYAAVSANVREREAEILAEEELSEEPSEELLGGDLPLGPNELEARKKRRRRTPDGSHSKKRSFDDTERGEKQKKQRKKEKLDSLGDAEAVLSVQNGRSPRKHRQKSPSPRRKRKKSKSRSHDDTGEAPLLEVDEQ